MFTSAERKDRVCTELVGFSNRNRHLQHLIVGGVGENLAHHGHSASTPGRVTMNPRIEISSRGWPAHSPYGFSLVTSATALGVALLAQSLHFRNVTGRGDHRLQLPNHWKLIGSARKVKPEACGQPGLSVKTANSAILRDRLSRSSTRSCLPTNLAFTESYTADRPLILRLKDEY